LLRFDIRGLQTVSSVDSDRAAACIMCE